MLVKIVNGLSNYMDPESVHHLSMKGIKWFGKKQKLKAKKVDGLFLNWENKIGLAAGFDKNGDYLNELSDLGFGALEVGTVTPKAQEGNIRPRIKKISSEKSILNWMGFPSAGMDVVYENVKKYRGKAPLGINIGKNKDTSSENALKDYLEVAEKFKDLADYFVINISSPNTKNLRDLQNVHFIKDLFEAYRDHGYKNVFIKLAPDLNEQDLYEIVDLVEEYRIGGIIATNTTIQHSFEKGGLSGKKLKMISYELIEKICHYKPERSFDLVACGGIDSINDIRRYEKLGVDFFQIYSSFVYEGPRIIKKLIS